jgi:hypothetical protein
VRIGATGCNHRHPELVARIVGLDVAPDMKPTPRELVLLLAYQWWLLAAFVPGGRMTLKRPFSDGTVAIDLDPLSLICRLCASVPAPRMHTVRYAGVLAAHSKLRRSIVPSAPTDDAGGAELEVDTGAALPRSRSSYRPWAELLKRTFGIDVEQCPSCGGRMRLVALVTAAHSIARILSHLGEPTQPPARAPARGPPYFASRAVRRKQGAQQGELLE